MVSSLRDLSGPEGAANVDGPRVPVPRTPWLPVIRSLVSLVRRGLEILHAADVGNITGLK